MLRDDNQIYGNQHPYVDKTLWPIISKSVYYHDSRDRFQVLSASRPRKLNPALRAEYEANREKQAATLLPGQELQEIYLFAKVNKDKMADICENGISRGNVFYSQIGKSQEGVCLVRCADVLDETRIKDGYQGMMILFKVSVRSLLEVENDVFNDKRMGPTPGFDGHVSWNWSLYEDYQQKQCSSSVDHYKLYYASQYYLYEFESDFRSTVKQPKHIIPYAVITFRYRAVSPPLTITNSLGTSESQKPKYNVWEGLLTYSQFPDDFLVRLTSHDRSFIPVAFGTISVRQFSLPTVLSEYFSNVKVISRSYVSSLRNVMYMRMSSVEPVNDFEQMIESLKSQDSVAVQCLSRYATLILMPSSPATKNLELHAPFSSSCELHCFIIFDSHESSVCRFNSWISWRWSGNENDPNEIMDLRSAEWEQFDSGRPVAIPVNELIDIFEASNLSNTASDISNDACEFDVLENGNETTVSDTSINIEPEDGPVQIKSAVLSSDISTTEDIHPDHSESLICKDDHAELLQKAVLYHLSSSASCELPKLMEFDCEPQQSIEKNISSAVVLTEEAEAVKSDGDIQTSFEKGSQEATATSVEIGNQEATATSVEIGIALSSDSTATSVEKGIASSSDVIDDELPIQNEPMDLTVRIENGHLKAADEENVGSNLQLDADCISKPSIPRFLACHSPEPDDEFAMMVCTLPQHYDGKRRTVETQFYLNGEITKIDEQDRHLERVAAPIRSLKLFKTPDGNWSSSPSPSKFDGLKQLTAPVSLIKDLLTYSNDNAIDCTASCDPPPFKQNRPNNFKVKAQTKRRGRPRKKNVVTSSIGLTEFLVTPQDTVSTPIRPLPPQQDSRIPTTQVQTSPQGSMQPLLNNQFVQSPHVDVSPIHHCWPHLPNLPFPPVSTPIHPLFPQDSRIPTMQVEETSPRVSMHPHLNNQFVQSPHVEVSPIRHCRPHLPDPPFAPVSTPMHPLSPQDSRIPTTQVETSPRVSMQPLLNNQFVQSPHVEVSPNRHCRPHLPDPPEFSPIIQPLNPHNYSARTHMIYSPNQYGGFNANYSRLMNNSYIHPMQQCNSTPFRDPRFNECAGFVQQPRLSNGWYTEQFLSPSVHWTAQSAFVENSHLLQTNVPFFPPCVPEHFHNSNLYPTNRNQSIGSNNYLNFTGINNHIYNVHISQAASNQQTHPCDVPASHSEYMPSLGIDCNNIPCPPQSNNNHNVPVSNLPGLMDDFAVCDMEIE